MGESLILTAADEALIDLALEEDFGAGRGLSGDLTTAATIPVGTVGRAKIIAREPLIVCGHSVAKRVFEKLDAGIRYAISVDDGNRAESEETIALVQGSFAAILSGERVALNFLQRLCGIATQTDKIAKLIKNTSAEILDTRKTTPGMRRLEKYAVRTGGGRNHRFGLHDEVLIKNNHIDALGGDAAKAVRLCRENAPQGTKIEVEVRNEAELRAALAAVPDAILLDNMEPQQIRACLSLADDAGLRNRISFEASGGITEANITLFAATGVDFISLGALTHSVRSSDLSLRFLPS